MALLEAAEAKPTKCGPYSEKANSSQHVEGCKVGSTIEKFNFELEQTEDGQHIFKPYVHIVLDNYSPTTKGMPSISPQLIHEGEIDEYITALKADLDAVGRRAKRALRKARAETDKRASYLSEDSN